MINIIGYFLQNNNNFTALLFFIPHNPYAISQEDSKSGILGGMQDVVENAILIKRAKSKQFSLLEFKFQYCFQCDCSDRSPEKGAPPPQQNGGVLSSRNPRILEKVCPILPFLLLIRIFFCSFYCIRSFSTSLHAIFV